ncbi:hypothetical protein L1887_00641 [Cichorium endivia]|nr:hypothetical protein L1887_00641 [Cichorium endivia]
MIPNRDQDPTPATPLVPMTRTQRRLPSTSSLPRRAATVPSLISTVAPFLSIYSSSPSFLIFAILEITHTKSRYKLMDAWYWVCLDVARSFGTKRVGSLSSGPKVLPEKKGATGSGGRVVLVPVGYHRNGRTPPENAAAGARSS